MDELLGDLPDEVEPPSETPEPGETYQRVPDEPRFPVADVGWQHEKHALWAKVREAKGLEGPFYVRSAAGTLGWVPWPGSKVVWPHEMGWEMDLLQGGSPQPKPSWLKKR